MNRKEAVVVVAVLLSTFIGGAYAAQNVPSIQQVFVTNFPKNQNVIVTNLPQSTPTLKTTSTDIEAFKFDGAIVIAFDANSNTAYATPSTGAVMGNLTLAFSFAPNIGFQQVTSVRAMILYEAGIVSNGLHYCACGSQPGDTLLALMNGMLVSSSGIAGSFPSTTVLTLANLQAGSNILSLGISNPSTPGIYSVYEVRLTVSYTYLG